MMQKLSRSLYSVPVIDMRGGTIIANATEPIINPHNLKILGWHCKQQGLESILLAEDVREILIQGLAINDESALSAPDDLVRHKEVLDINFQLIGKPVKTKREKLGKVGDYAFDDSSMMVESIYVEPPLTRIFGSHDTRIIGRRQIKEVTDSYILVDDAEIEVADALPEEIEIPVAGTA